MKSKQNKRKKQAENRLQMNKSSISSSSSSSSLSISTSFQHKEVEEEEERGAPMASQINNSVNNIPATIEWLKHIGYEDCGIYFREHRINGRALLMLGEDDLKEIIKHNVGQRKNLYHLIRLIQIKYNRYMNKLNSSFFSNSGDEEEDEQDEQEEKNVYETDENEHENDENHLNEKNAFKVEKKKVNNGSIKTNQNKQISYDDEKSSSENSSLIHNHLVNETKKDQESSSDEQDFSNMKKRNFEHQNHRTGNRSSPKNACGFLKINRNEDNENEHGMLNFCENCLKKFDESPYTNYSLGNSSNTPIRSYKGEKRKTLLAMIYLFMTCLWTSFMLTVVHDRVPDMQKYPPLPDIILDNVPLIPWAFFATEIIGLVLAFIMLIVLIFHKYRMIIFRRICSLAGTIFFLRSITMLITSLSVPGIHIQCSSQKYGSLMNKLNGAWNILSGVGLYVHGIRTCGDYMFSGHTVWLTLMTHFVTEYTPSSMSLLHTFSWILNIFGLFFILGAHEHYSIDVFVAFYITSRLFLYYHSLSNNKVLFQRDHKRVKIWFPMLSYFEANIHSIVPNHYEFPPSFCVYFFKSIRNKFRVIKRFVGKLNNGYGLKQKTN